ncbi:MAG: hypothetical protein QOH50_4682, partial [Kribbellaceae bacterium]|nr:hypothetical protein [Kribbellaceae bacterium]
MPEACQTTVGNDRTCRDPRGDADVRVVVSSRVPGVNGSSREHPGVRPWAGEDARAITDLSRQFDPDRTAHQ